MPVMDGREMIEKIREQNNLRDAIVFMISAHTESIINSEILDCNAFISKPIDLKHLLELLETHLQLEWKTSQTIASKNDKSTFSIPPQNKLTELLQLVNLGDIEAIE